MRPFPLHPAFRSSGSRIAGRRATPRLVPFLGRQSFECHLASKEVAIAFALLFTIIGGAWAQASDPSEAQSSPAFVRAHHLNRGVNTSEWFAQVYDKRGYTKEHFQEWTTADDIALIKSAGFDHVRLSVNPQPMMTDRRGQ